MRPALLAPQQKEEQAVGDNLHEHEAKMAENGLNHLDLRLGITSDEDLSQKLLTAKGPWLGGANSRSFSETAGGYVHSWSLAAGKEKGALEQVLHQREKRPSSPFVGWPPVRTYRKNLCVSNLSKATDAEDPNNKKSTDQEENTKSDPATKPSMFVKVNLEGYAVGRKIDLRAHGSYNSLSQALQKMFHNFFSVDYSKKVKQDEPVEAGSKNYILLYEDNEGDRMLVGDVPWELFLASVKRLYITQIPRAQKTVE